MDRGGKEKQQQAGQADNETLLTLSNIQYLVEGLDSLLHTNLDGDKRAKVIKLRDELSAYVSGMFFDLSPRKNALSLRYGIRIRATCINFNNLDETTTIRGFL